MMLQQLCFPIQIPSSTTFNQKLNQIHFSTLCTSKKGQTHQNPQYLLKQMLGQKLIFKQDRNRRGGGNAGGGSILSIPLFIIIAIQVDLKRSQNSKQLEFLPQTPTNLSVDPYKQSMGQELLMVVQNSLVLWIPRANQSQWSEKQFQLSYSTILIPGQGQGPHQQKHCL